MDNHEITALFWLVEAVAYRVWAFKQSVPILDHRRMTFWCAMFFAFGFWQWGEQGEFVCAFGGFIAGWIYMGVRSALKAHHLFGKQIADCLTQQGL
jgi:hypothetical protein